MSDKELISSEESGAKLQEWSASLKIEMPLSDAVGMRQALHIAVDGPMVGKTMALLTRPLLAAIGTTSGPVILDLRHVFQIDSDGLSLLLNAHKALPVEMRPLSLRLTRGSQPERVLTLAGFEMIMTLLTKAD